MSIRVSPWSKMYKLHQVDTMIPFVALTFFLSSAKSSPDDAHRSFLREYLERHSDCEHALSPLAFDREKRTQDLVGHVIYYFWWGIFICMYVALLVDMDRFRLCFCVL